jgi:hypothetical protein
MKFSTVIPLTLIVACYFPTREWSEHDIATNPDTYDLSAVKHSYAPLLLYVEANADADAAKSAANEWNTACNEELVRITASVDASDINVIHITGKLGRLDKDYIGITECASHKAQHITYQIDSAYSTMQILTHEFGHALLGCSDADHSSNGVMQSASPHAIIDPYTGHLVAGSISTDQCNTAMKRRAML